MITKKSSESKNMTEQTETKVAVNTQEVNTTPAASTIPVNQPPIAKPKEVTIQPTTTSDVVNKITAAQTISNKLLINQSEAEWVILVSDIETSGTEYQKILLGFLKTYIKDMAVGLPVDPRVGANKQSALWQHIKNILDKIPTDEFVDVWKLLLRFAYQNRNSVFNETHIFRFITTNWNNQNDIIGFTNILKLIISTADTTQAKNNLAKIDLNKATSTGISNIGKNRIISFYNLK